MKSVQAARRGRGSLLPADRGCVVQYHAPAVGGEVVGIGCNQGGLGRSLPADADLLFDDVYHDIFALRQACYGAHPEVKSGTALEHLLPTCANGASPCQHRPHGMNAHNLVVVRPGGHHRLNIGALERVIKGPLHLRRVGESRVVHGRGTSATGIHDRLSRPPPRL
jgi:hypothetical protein